MDRDNGNLLAAFSTVLPLDGPPTTPCVNPISDEVVDTLGTAETPEPVDDDEAITGAGGAYM